MSTNQHTPGPWRVTTDGDSDPIVWADQVTAIARVYAGPLGGTTRRESNARLIASSPALLAALKAMVEARDNQGRPNPVEARVLALVAARAAIAQAEGEPMAKEAQPPADSFWTRYGQALGDDVMPH